MQTLVQQRVDQHKVLPVVAAAKADGLDMMYLQAVQRRDAHAQLAGDVLAKSMPRLGRELQAELIILAPRAFLDGHGGIAEARRQAYALPRYVQPCHLQHRGNQQHEGRAINVLTRHRELEPCHVIAVRQPQRSAYP